ncbi:MAG: amino acid deaminase/aldolase [Mycobacteriales bacterium]
MQTRYDAATADLDPPFALVDLDAFRENAASLVKRAGGRPIRVASKSVRCRALIAEALGRDGFAGVMAYTLPEALWLVETGVSDDVLVGYPTADRAALRRLAADPAARAAVTLMVDSADHLDLADATLGAGHPELRVCLELDSSWELLGGRVHLGALRSPVHSPAQARAVAAAIADRPGFRLVGVMGYEAQIAGVGDAPPGRRLYGTAVHWMQGRSAAELAARRTAAVEAVRTVADLEFVNGGGTGSLESTVADPSVTEVTAGSGLYGPVLFDAYTHFQPAPAALFALPVVRRPKPGVVTVLGGGYLASGPADKARLPQPYLPRGLRLTGTEGAGEVQTPLTGAVSGLAVGDRVWFRHAKAGELCERFDSLLLYTDNRVIDKVPTYRGERQTFL